MSEQPKEGDDAYALQNDSEHEHQCTNTEEEYPTWKETDEETEINTRRQSQRERHEWNSQTECEPSQQMPDRR
jgi:hypothetical protein